MTVDDVLAVLRSNLAVTPNLFTLQSWCRWELVHLSELNKSEGSLLSGGASAGHGVAQADAGDRRVRPLMAKTSSSLSNITAATKIETTL